MVRGASKSLWKQLKNNNNKDSRRENGRQTSPTPTSVQQGTHGPRGGASADPGVEQENGNDDEKIGEDDDDNGDEDEENDDGDSDEKEGIMMMMVDSPSLTETLTDILQGTGAMEEKQGGPEVRRSASLSMVSPRGGRGHAHANGGKGSDAGEGRRSGSIELPNGAALGR